MSKNWTQITIYAPPGSWIIPTMEQWLRVHGFTFNAETVDYEDEDGAVADFSRVRTPSYTRGDKERGRIMARDLRRAFANATERQAVIDEALRLDGRGWTQQRIATALGVSQPTVHSWLDKHSPRRLSLQARIASEIRRELVCCDIYEQIQALRADLEAQQQLRESKKFRGHDTCFHGEWAAQIAEKVAK